MQALQESNPGTVVLWKYKAIAEGVYYSNMEVFERVFWAFKPSIDGFKHCMPLLSIDETHLYGKYKGTLLVATSVDANFQVFPLAFAIVEGENTSSWSWFLSCIRVHVTDREGLCVISDRHAGIIAAMTNPDVGFHEPRAFHRFCVRQMASNLRTHVKNNDMRDRFKAAAYQRQEKKLVEDMHYIGEACVKSLEYITDVPFHRWSLFHDAGRRHGICTTNFSETFNNVLKGARFLPIMSLVELTFHRVNKYFNRSRDSSLARRAHGYAYSPKVTAILEKNNRKAKYHTVDVYSRQLEIMEGQDQGQTGHDPGPADPSVLTLQDTHRSRDIWEQIGDPARCLVCRHHVATTVVDWVVDPRVLQYIDFVVIVVVPVVKVVVVVVIVVDALVGVVAVALVGVVAVVVR
ncbi:uncharacterized protein LOC110714810 [Chenopodium quinoa]|uniref:uncharacterized protein LOC110714810 n=1 Tax=Chenopodium quinoa TaxID=63459 RepID=UPI000B7830F7|nr:uncharacterized protein LOC110714810 [Chenopodium quinoa]